MKYTCKTCRYRAKMSSGKRSAMYCTKHTSTRTRNRWLRVKCNQPGCDIYSYCAEASSISSTPSNQLSLEF